MVVGSPRPQDVFEGDYTVTNSSYVAPMELIGDDKSNLLTGGGGDDILSGKQGADTLIGGGGNDIMDGGTGNDIFVFGPDFGNDTIRGFDAKARVVKTASTSLNWVSPLPTLLRR